MYSDRNRVMFLTMAFGLLSMFAMGQSRASIVTDIPNSLNQALLGGSSLWAAQAILTAAIMMSCGLALAMLKMPPPGMFMVLLTVLGALTGIGWADISFLAMAGFIAVAMFGKTMAEWLLGESTGAK